MLGLNVLKNKVILFVLINSANKINIKNLLYLFFAKEGYLNLLRKMLQSFLSVIYVEI